MTIRQFLKKDFITSKDQKYMTGKKIIEEEISYNTFDGTQVKAFVARPSDEKKHPAIIVIQEIWGLTNFLKSVASRLAEEGFVAMAPHLYSRKDHIDLYTEENIMDAMRPMWSLPPEKRRDQNAIKELLAKSSDTSKKIINDLMFNRQSFEETMAKDLIDGHKFLKNRPYTNGKMGVVGFCMGGGLSFQVSTMAPFDATVVYYGANPKNLDDISKLKGPVFGIYAGEDGPINAGLPELIPAILKHKKSFEMKIYPNTQHAFFNHTGLAYDEKAAKDVWPLTVKFFSHNLGD